MMLTFQDVVSQIKEITTSLMECGLIDYQNFPSTTTHHDNIKIVNFGNIDFSISLRNCDYNEIYNELKRRNSYNFKLLDGALIQMMYKFKGENLFSHRLAFFSSPNLESFQKDPQIYEEDEIYADIIKKNIVSFPLRFDYDSISTSTKIHHPLCHLTLGQYENCRIPVTAPLTPCQFMHFILQNFYNTAYNCFSNKIKTNNKGFDDTITDFEKTIIHIHLPMNPKISKCTLV